MRIRFLTLLLAFFPTLAGLAQSQRPPQIVPLPYPAQYRNQADYLRAANIGHYPGAQFQTPFANGQTIDVLAEAARRADASALTLLKDEEYEAYLEHKRRRELRAQSAEPQVHADPDAPDQSELLKNSRDHDFILRNFRTMYIDASEAKFFSADLVKAALGRNKEFQKLRVRIVDDPRVADAVLKITYSFAWDYPFELRHQNTTYVLLSGKGEGPFYGPLGADDVARQFVNATKPWRETKKEESK